MDDCSFDKLFVQNSAEALILDERVVKAGNQAEFFFAYFILDDILYSLNCLHHAAIMHADDPASQEDRILLKQYRKNVNGYEVNQVEDLGPGRDPRVVSDEQNAYAIITTVEYIEGKSIHRASLYDIRKRKRILILAQDPGFTYGKNWQPFLREGKLFVVHQLTPYRVYAINIHDGSMTLDHEADISFKLPQFHSVFNYTDESRSFPMFRGGCNAIVSNGWIHGVGKATSQVYRHHPFFWSACKGNDLEIVFTGFFYDLHKCGFNIIDPTSLFYYKGDLYLGLCCTERDWIHTQAALHLLLVFRHTESSIGERLSNYLKRSAVSEAGGIPNLSRHMFFCIEMESAIASMHEYGGRLSVGHRGHLVHGPYLPITTEDLFCAELSYLTKTHQSGEIVAGNFEVTACKLDETGKSISFKRLALVELGTTDFSIQETRVMFDTTGLMGGVLEFRVFVEESILLNAYHIRTWKLTDSPACTTSP